MNSVPCHLNNVAILYEGRPKPNSSTSMPAQRAAISSAAAASPGQTLRDVLAGFATLLLPVEDPHVLHDVDTDHDYRELLGGLATTPGA